MSKRSISLLFILFIWCVPTLKAQDQKDLDYRKWRITLFPPISTNGANATNFTAKYSINLVGGVHGGLNGKEFGLLFNINKHYSYGAQFAGGFNYTGGDQQGLGIAGLANITQKDMSGLQISGVSNFTGDDLEGLQITGGLNISKGRTSGLQMAGFGNIGKNGIEGMQTAGLFNYSGNNLSGIEIAGGANIAKDDIEGIQVASLFNYSGKNISGIEIAGGANIATKDMQGMQISGIMNLSGGSIEGVMSTGGINYAKSITGLSMAGVANISTSSEGLQISAFNLTNNGSGLQIGVLNYAKEFDGAPIGLLSLYGNGRKNIDVRFSDGGFTDIALTTGTYRVYNMLMVGINPMIDRNVYRIGFGLGLEKNIQDSFEHIESTTLFVNQEFSIHHMWEDDWDRTLNRIYSYKFMIGKRFASGLSLYGGPSLNMQVTRVTEAEDYAWYSLWSPSGKGRNYQFWVGFTTGIRIFKQKELPLMNEHWDRM